MNKTHNIRLWKIRKEIYNDNNIEKKGKLIIKQRRKVSNTLFFSHRRRSLPPPSSTRSSFPSQVNLFFIHPFLF